MQQDIKQIRGASQSSILFLGTNSVVSEDYKLRWVQSSDQLVVDGNIKITDGNQSSGYVLVSDSTGLATWSPTPVTSWSSSFNNGNVGSLTYLRRQDGTPTNISPYVVPVDMSIIMVAASSDTDQNWSMTIRKTDSVGLTYSTIHTITATSSRQQINTGLNINLNAGDRVATRLEVGTSIDYPNMDIYVRIR